MASRLLHPQQGSGNGSNRNKGNDFRNTDMHKPEGIFRGEKIGHSDRESHIRKRDGVIFNGEEMGYVDREKHVRRPDGIIFKGEVVGNVRENQARAKDGIIFEGEQWGYVDDSGNIHQRDGLIFSGRIIGQMRGHNKEAALGFFMLRFNELVERFEALEAEARSAEHKGKYIGQVRHMLEYVPKYDGLGDFDNLIRRLKQLEHDLVSEVERARSSKANKKRDLIREARNWGNSSEWKAAGEKIKALQAKWKEIGGAGNEEENLWQDFRDACDHFFERRTAHFQELDKKRSDNASKKKSLVSEAQRYSHSSDWKNAGEEIKGLQARWKQIGHAGDEDDGFWQAFRQACDTFFERRTNHFEELDRERMENARRKESLCSRAESLRHSDDLREAIEEVKELQAKWKEIGHVPREMADSLWERFREACDKVFEAASAQRERKQHEWREKMHEVLSAKREQANRLRESIEHDEGLVSHWEEVISNLHDGSRADEIRDSMEEKISSVQDRISSKEEKIREIEEAIGDIENKLGG